MRVFPKTSKKRAVIAAVCAVLLLAAVVVIPVACGGGGGGFGLAIATVGVSAVLAGMSPGWCIRDEQFATPLTGTDTQTVLGASINTNVPTEPDIVIPAGDEVDRVILLGGSIGGPITIKSEATADTAGSELSIECFYLGWSDKGGTPESLGALTVPIGTTATQMDLKFDKVQKNGEEHLFRSATLSPGTQIRIRLKAATGQITIDADKTEIAYTSGQLRQSTFLFGNRFSALVPDNTDRQFEMFEGQDVDLHPVSAPSTAATREPVNNITNAFPSSFLVTAGNGQAVRFTAQLIDADDRPVVGAHVQFLLIGSAQSLVGGGDSNSLGQVSHTFVMPTSLQSVDVTATVIRHPDGSQASSNLRCQWSVTLLSGTNRPFDGLTSLAINTANGTATATIGLDVSQIAREANVRGITDGKTTQPTKITYVFERHVPSGLEWEIDLWARTRSPRTNATASFQVRILDATRNAELIAESKVISIGASTVNVRETLVAIQPSVSFEFSDLENTSVAIDAFLLEIAVLSSSDSNFPGIELLAGGAAPLPESFLRMPGPIVYATSPNAAVGTFLASQPDPRRTSATQEVEGVLVGAWASNLAFPADDTDILVFLRDGDVFAINDVGSGSNEVDGFALGRFSWTPSTGAFSAALRVNTSGGSEIPTKMLVNGDNLTVFERNGDIQNNVRLPSTPNDIVGAWVIASTQGKAVFVFTAANQYFMAEDHLVSEAGIQDGIERGTFAWDSATGTFSATQSIDTNGATGLSNLSSMNLVVNGNVLTITGTPSGGGSATFSVDRVVP